MECWITMCVYIFIAITLSLLFLALFLSFSLSLSKVFNYFKHLLYYYTNAYLIIVCMHGIHDNLSHWAKGLAHYIYRYMIIIIERLINYFKKVELLLLAISDNYHIDQLMLLWLWNHQPLINQPTNQ